MGRDPNIPDAFDVYTLVLLRRPGDGAFQWKLTDHDRSVVRIPFFTEQEAYFRVPEFVEAACASAPSAGHCNTMGTASTMAVVAEALGMSMDQPGTGRWAEPLSAMYAELACADG
mgnify:CR=1 FL=1